MIDPNRGSNQSVLVSGESGSGKTEATKLMMNYFAFISESKQGSAQVHMTVDKVVQSNPLLEAFGNAKTVRNNNSSRFGKWIEIQFNKDACVCGAVIRTYLLEKSRVVVQNPGERNYHIFYQILKGLPAETKEKLLMPGDASTATFNFLNAAGGDVVTGSGNVVDSLDDAARFKHTVEAMNVTGIAADQQFKVWKILAAILHLGNVEFVGSAGDQVSISNPEVLERAAKLLHVDAAQLSSALTNATLIIRNEKNVKRLTIDQARDTRGALCKSLYSAVFDWLVMQINLCLYTDQSVSFIGILDIFGFESFSHNSLEQLLINYTNEALQQQFISDFFKTIQQQYEEDGVEFEKVKFTDNQACLDVMDKAGNSVFGILNDVCRINGDDSQFYTRVLNLRSHQCFIAPKKKSSSFGIQHFADAVEYDVAGFVEKNREPLSDDIVSVLAIVAEGTTVLDKQVSSESTVKAKSSGTDTVFSRFKTNLAELLTSIRATAIHYVRCVQPNAKQMPQDVDFPHIIRQLRYSGVVSAVKMAQTAFPNRLLYGQLASRYRPIFLPGIHKAPNAGAYIKASLADLVSRLGMDGHNPTILQCGVQRAYMGKGVLELLEKELGRIQAVAVAKLQRIFRMVGSKKELQMSRRAVLTIQRVFRMSVCRKEFLETSAKVQVLQRAARRRQAAKLRSQLARVNAAATIQAAFRKHVQRQRFKAIAKATRLLQRNFRKHRARVSVMKRLTEKRKILESQSKEDAWKTTQRLQEEIERLQQALQQQADEHQAEIQRLKEANRHQAKASPHVNGVVESPLTHSPTTMTSSSSSSTTPHKDSPAKPTDQSVVVVGGASMSAEEVEDMRQRIRQELEEEMEEILLRRRGEMEREFSSKPMNGHVETSLVAAASVASSRPLTESNAAPRNNVDEAALRSAWEKEKAAEFEQRIREARQLWEKENVGGHNRGNVQVPPHHHPQENRNQQTPQSHSQNPARSHHPQGHPNGVSGHKHLAFAFDDPVPQSHFAVSEDHLVATLHESSALVSVLRANAALDSGLWEWEFEILHSGTQVLFGILDSTVSLNSQLKGAEVIKNGGAVVLSCPKSGSGRGLHSNGTLITNSTPTFFHPSDRVVLTLNVDKRSLKYTTYTGTFKARNILPAHAFVPFIALSGKDASIRLVRAGRGSLIPKKGILGVFQRLRSKSVAPSQQQQQALAPKFRAASTRPTSSGGRVADQAGPSRRPAHTSPHGEPRSMEHEEEKRHFRALFRMFDLDHDGFIGRYEFVQILQQHRMQRNKDFDQPQAERLFLEIDLNGDGVIDMTEFNDWLGKRKRFYVAEMMSKFEKDHPNPTEPQYKAARSDAILHAARQLKPDSWQPQSRVQPTQPDS
eukprot:c39275_g1_i1.p1 GENE.c39275_g1_i1~~c39275_g1_i1.p1  ORF type:complete len:1519 (+),score=378.34 c39275_g1_i1:458-4558(+)